jgi:hypothetical protein
MVPNHLKSQMVCLSISFLIVVGSSYGYTVFEVALFQGNADTLHWLLDVAPEFAWHFSTHLKYTAAQMIVAHNPVSSRHKIPTHRRIEVLNKLMECGRQASSGPIDVLRLSVWTPVYWYQDGLVNAAFNPARLTNSVEGVNWDIIAFCISLRLPLRTRLNVPPTVIKAWRISVCTEYALLTHLQSLLPNDLILEIWAHRFCVTHDTRIFHLD